MLKQASTDFIHVIESCIPYGWKIWRGIEFDHLVVCLCNHQIGIHQNILLAYIHCTDLNQ